MDRIRGGDGMSGKTHTGQRKALKAVRGGRRNRSSNVNNKAGHFKWKGGWGFRNKQGNVAFDTKAPKSGQANIKYGQVRASMGKQGKHAARAALNARKTAAQNKAAKAKANKASSYSAWQNDFNKKPALKHQPFALKSAGYMTAMADAGYARDSGKADLAERLRQMKESYGLDTEELARNTQKQNMTMSGSMAGRGMGKSGVFDKAASDISHAHNLGKSRLDLESGDKAQGALVNQSGLLDTQYTNTKHGQEMFAEEEWKARHKKKKPPKWSKGFKDAGGGKYYYDNGAGQRKALTQGQSYLRGKIDKIQGNKKIPLARRKARVAELRRRWANTDWGK